MNANKAIIASNDHAIVDWYSRHRAAWSAPTAIEQPLVNLIRALAAMTAERDALKAELDTLKMDASKLALTLATMFNKPSVGDTILKAQADALAGALEHYRHTIGDVSDRTLWPLAGAAADRAAAALAAYRANRGGTAQGGAK